MRKFVIGFTTFALAAAMAASSYRVTLFQASTIGGQELKAGEYKIEVKDNKAVVKAGKQQVEADVKVESAEQKFSSTSVRYAEGGKVQEIRLGGTNTRLVFAN
jgi:hypothetical protein